MSALSNASATASPDTPLRKRLEKLLGQDAQYLRLRDNSKIPQGRYKHGGNRLKKIPKDCAGYGVIPQNRLVIFDLDTHRKDTWHLEQQLDYLTDLLQVDLRASLAVVTQSGGFHVYLYLPKEIELSEISKFFPRGSLRNYNKALSEYSNHPVKLDADVRTSFSAGYVVGAGSHIEYLDKKTQFNRYLLANESFGFENPRYEILTIPTEGLLKLKKVSAIRVRQRKRLSDWNKGIEKDLQELDKEVDIIFGKTPTVSVDFTQEPEEITTAEKHSTASSETIARLRSKLKDTTEPFHILRATVKSALHCCHDDYAIALACIELGVDKDSYREESLGFAQLLQDISRFRPEQKYHGPYCYVGRKKIREAYSRAAEYSDEFDADNFRAANRSKIAEQKNRAKVVKFVSPKVIDVGKISKTLVKDSRKRKVSQQYSDAMAIVDYYLQPLSNVGSNRLLLAHADISRVLAIDKGRVSQAMRLLRNRGILQMERKQRLGMAALYSVSEDYTQRYLTKALKMAWGKFNSDEHYGTPHPVYMNFADSSFRTVFGNMLVEPVKNVDKEFENMRSALLEGYVPEDFNAGAAERYLVAEKEILMYSEEHETNTEEYDKNVLSVRLDDESKEATIDEPADAELKEEVEKESGNVSTVGEDIVEIDEGVFVNAQTGEIIEENLISSATTVPDLSQPLKPVGENITGTDFGVHNSSTMGVSLRKGMDEGGHSFESDQPEHYGTNTLVRSN